MINPKLLDRGIAQYIYLAANFVPAQQTKAVLFIRL